VTGTEPLLPEKRSQIMRGATRIFAADGYEGASMSRIAAEAAVSKGTLYNYFESKSELFAAYVAEECSRRLSFVFNDIDWDGEPDTVLRAIAQRMIALMLSPSGLTTFRVVVSEASKFPELARVYFDAGPARAIRTLADWLIAATRRGRLDVPDPELAAEQFFALCQTRLVMRRRLAILEEPLPGEIERIVEANVTMFLRTFKARAHVRPEATDADRTRACRGDADNVSRGPEGW